MEVMVTHVIGDLLAAIVLKRKDGPCNRAEFVKPGPLNFSKAIQLTPWMTDDITSAAEMDIRRSMSRCIK